MSYEDNGYRWVAVLNRKIELGRLLNALSHTTAGLVGHADLTESPEFLNYLDADGTSHPAISQYPFIVLSARNGNQIRRLREAVKEASLPYNDFVNTMIGDSSADQLEKTLETAEKDLEYYCLVTFGPSGILQPLTKKFSVFKEKQAPTRDPIPASSPSQFDRSRLDIAEAEAFRPSRTSSDREDVDEALARSTGQT